ncbi:MAG: FAD binding domain-containing protein, partial [Phycisphaerales bacterium]|nr:FAD binding domain-containing protein [Phycisphaerales bacterium]
MNRFTLVRPKSYADASGVLTSKTYSLPVLKAGGLDVLDHMKEGLWSPDALVDVKRLMPADQREPIAAFSADVNRSLTAPPPPKWSSDNGFVHVAASALLADVAASPQVLGSSPVVAQSLGSAATPQVRNVGTVAGNLLQRPRCWYYRQQQFDCLKKGGSQCFAVEGENTYHAIFGPGPCHIVHPSNLAPALMVCNGRVDLIGGKRDSLKISELFHMPEKGITSEHNLEPGEIITHIRFDARPISGFYSIKHKQSFDWPLVFACVALAMEGDKISAASVCAGAVAPVPWMLPSVAAALVGVSPDDDAAITAACAKAGEGAKPMRDNGYKVQLLSVAVKRAILVALKKPVPGQ